GDLIQPRRLHEQALSIRRSLNDTRTIVESRMALAAIAIEEGRAADAEREARDLQKTVASESDRARRIDLAILVARARLGAGDVDGADRALAAVRPLATKTEQMEPRVHLTLAEAELQALRGDRERARECLTALRGSVARAGMLLAELECRTSILRLDRTDQRPSVRDDEASLKKDAQARGIGLVLRRLQMI